jgi:DNA-binding transcriptional regulator YiaG
MGGSGMNGIALHHAGEKQKKPLHYTACGLDDVYLLSGYEVEETSYGKGISIKNADNLHRVIGGYLVANKKLLSGKEIRFLRHQMDFTQSELARLLGGSAQQVARYEKDECEMPGPADRILRLLFNEHIQKKVLVRDLLKIFDQMDDRTHNRMVFEPTESGWKKAA